MEVLHRIEAAPFLLDSGLLFEINRRVLHPLGLAIEVMIDENGHMTIENLWDCREDPEGLTYEELTFQSGLKKFNDFMTTYGNAKLTERKATLGYIVQGE